MSSIKDLFGKSSGKVLSATSIEDIGDEIESPNYALALLEDRQRYVPDIDYTNFKNFARFGSVEKYYTDAINNIARTYPYDGSLYEKLAWYNSGSSFQNYVFDNEYPRKNGHITIGNQNDNSPLAWAGGYASPYTKEYIIFKGSMNKAISGSTLAQQFDYSNKYDPDLNRKYNLAIDGENGLTFEFYYRSYSAGYSFSEEEKVVIFDLWNSGTLGSPSYGRFKVELRPQGDSTAQSFYVELMSGSSGVLDAKLGQGLTFTSGSEWHHYAISAISTGSNLLLNVYVDGDHNQTIVTGSSISYVTGAYIGTVGSLVTSVTGNYGSLGWGKISNAYFDELRYWKQKRTDKQIQKYWFTQVGGGTNTDESNIELGLYYKFNEGIFNTASHDARDTKILDYSGRLSNGTYVGYSYQYSRMTGSAMVDGGFADREFLDPIVYLQHPEVQSLLSQKITEGYEYDTVNNSAIINSFPQWMKEEDEVSLKNLSQIVGEFFDDLYLKIESLPKIREASYRDNKPLPFAGRLLESVGFTTSDLFTDSSIIESLISRSENIEYEEKIHNIKNFIYQNIYNNLIYILRSKGTEKSIRNLVRSFGIDDKLIKLNIYADGVDYSFDNRYENTTVRKKYVDFNDPDRFTANVYQAAAQHVVPLLDDTQAEYFIPGNINKAYLGTTFQSEVIFPKKYSEDSSLFFRTDFVSCSLMGMHEANTSSNTDYSWFGSDKSNLRIYAIRPEEESKNVYFKVTSSYLGINLTSSLFYDVYDNQKWNISCKLYHEKYPFADGILTGSNAGNYTLDFIGYNYSQDVIQNEFKLSTTITSSLALEHFSAAKRIYVGAHRTNNTGSIVVGPGNSDEQSDVKISSVRYWLTALPDSILREHAKDATNVGSKDPAGNVDAYLSVALGDRYVPGIKTLALNWDFENVLSSSAGSGFPPSNTSDGDFYVLDVSSGSYYVDIATLPYQWMSLINSHHYVGRGDFFLRNKTNVVDREYVFTAKRRLPETLNSADLINILSQDDEIYTRDSLPVNHYFALEKSMYQTISEEIVKYFGTLTSFNNLIGEPINRYKQQYDSLNYLRRLFFEKIDNIPDFEKYVDYYKWIDGAMVSMISQLIPASANFSPELRTVIESHILERNKYWTKYPTLELKKELPIGGIRGINELRYNWKKGHAPIPLTQDVSCFWWKERAERRVHSSTINLNSNRANILDITLQTLNRSYTIPYDFNVDSIVRTNFKRVSQSAIKQVSKFGSNAYLLIATTDVVDNIDCEDE